MVRRARASLSEVRVFPLWRWPAYLYREQLRFDGSRDFARRGRPAVSNRPGARTGRRTSRKHYAASQIRRERPLASAVTLGSSHIVGYATQPYGMENNFQPPS